MVIKCKKKPVAVEAVQWNGDNYDEISSFIGENLYVDGGTGEIFIPTLEGIMRASNGSYIIKGIKGEFYPCKEDIFIQTYDFPL